MTQKTSLWHRNNLSIVIFIFIVLFLFGQSYTGWIQYNEDISKLGGVEIGYSSYLTTSHFVEATFENWESEFLQMGMYVLFTVFLRQKGSSESKPLEGKQEVDREPQSHPRAPWPVKKGGLWLSIYKNSLCLAFLILFLISFVLHFVSSNRIFNKEQLLQGKSSQTLVEYLSNSKFWFESFQNWQSEFVAVFSIVVLSIFLRQHGSPESKPVDAPHDETGE